MQITLNNRPEKFDGFEKITIQQLLEIKNYSYKMLLVRVNEHTIKREDYDSEVITEGDKVAVIHLMTGG
jgi:thiamine biosynthesis protein ThiS